MTDCRMERRRPRCQPRHWAHHPAQIPGADWSGDHKKRGTWRRQGAQPSQVILPSSSSALRMAHLGGTLKTCFGEGAEVAGSPHHYMDKPLNLSDPNIFLWESGMDSVLLSLPWLRGERRLQMGKILKTLKTFCVLLGWQPCLQGDKASIQMLKQPKYEDSMVSTGLRQPQPGKQLTSPWWPLPPACPACPPPPCPWTLFQGLFCFQKSWSVEPWGRERASGFQVVRLRGVWGRQDERGVESRLLG